jgi:hypothetical protein
MKSAESNWRMNVFLSPLFLAPGRAWMNRFLPAAAVAAFTVSQFSFWRRLLRPRPPATRDIFISKINGSTLASYRTICFWFILAPSRCPMQVSLGTNIIAFLSLDPDTWDARWTKTDLASIRKGSWLGWRVVCVIVYVGGCMGTLCFQPSLYFLYVHRLLSYGGAAGVSEFVLFLPTHSSTTRVAKSVQLLWLLDHG